MTSPRSVPSAELQGIWRQMLLVGVPVIMLGVLVSLIFTSHDHWDRTFDVPLYGATLVMLVLGWLSSWRGWLPYQRLTLILIFGSIAMFALKLLLLAFYLPDGQRAALEVTETLVWLAPTVTWAMLTELPVLVRRIYHVALSLLSVLGGLLLWRVWQAQNVFDQNLFRTLAQLNLSAFMTLYGSSYYLIRSDMLGRLRGERDTLARLAYTDLLTGLPNRGRLEERLPELVRLSRPFTLLFVDVDSFKIVNDTLGHAAGDELLQAAAHVLRQFTPSPDDVYRISGDEFVLLLPGQDADAAERVAADLQQGMAEATSGLQGVATTLSIGLSAYPHDAQTPAELLRHADSAMYSVKRAGRAQVRRYQPEQDAATERYQELARALSHAHQRGEFHLVFQPVYRLTDMQMVKVEALIRWHHPELGVVSPAEFIPVAEQSGLIVNLGAWVLRESCRAVQQWPGLTISVNVSGLQLLRYDFPAQVLEALNTSGLAPKHLELELTETALLHEDRRAIATVTALSGLGLTLSLDDYGSGYSNLNRLRTLQLGGLKLDQSIVRGLNDQNGGPFARAVTQSAVTMAQALNIPLTAEGIETPELLALVRELGCELGQGYGLARPQPPEEITRLYQQQPASLAPELKTALLV